MVRILIDKAGVAVDDAVLQALTNKLIQYGLIINGSLNEATRGVIIVNTDMGGAEVMGLIRTAKKYHVCQTCQSVHIRGELPDDPFRCSCGKWLLLPAKKQF